VLAPHHQLGVVYYVEGKDEGSHRSIANHCPLSFREEGHDDTSNYEDDQDSTQHTSTNSEVNLGLESKDRQAEGDSGCDSNGNEDSINIIEGGDSAQHDSLTEGEHPEKDEVCWKLPPDTVTAGHGYEADQHDTHAGVVHPHVPLYVHLDIFHEHEGSNNSPSQDELTHQDAVHLSNKIPPDRHLPKTRHILRLIGPHVVVVCVVLHYSSGKAVGCKGSTLRGEGGKWLLLRLWLVIPRLLRWVD